MSDEERMDGDAQDTAVPEEGSCLRGDLSGLDDEEKGENPRTPTVDLNGLVTTDDAEANVAVLQYPDYYAHTYDQDYYDYTPGRDTPITCVVIHFMAGSFWGSVNWNKDAQAQTSWHYGVAKDGYTIQMLSEDDTAWHVGVWWYNQRAVGIEQAGYGNPEDWTDAMIHSTAKLTAGICLRYDIPITRYYIFGHSEAEGATHTDVGDYFPWDRFMGLVEEYAGKASGGEEPPTSDTVYRVIAGSFKERENADERGAALTASGFGTPWIYEYEGMWRVQASSWSRRSDADEVVQALAVKGFGAFLVVEDPKAKSPETDPGGEETPVFPPADTWWCVENGDADGTTQYDYYIGYTDLFPQGYPFGCPGGTDANGYAVGDMKHKGTDVPAPTGSKIYAWADGYVRFNAYDEGGYNRFMGLKFDASDDSLDVGHLGNDYTSLAAGTRFRQGDVIATVGTDEDGLGFSHAHWRAGAGDWDTASVTPCGGYDPLILWRALGLPG